MIWEWMFNSLWGWVGVTGLIVAAAIVVAFFVPQLRGTMLAVAGAALAIGAAYAKGQRDRANLEHRRKERAVKQAREKYDAINRRPDTDRTVEDRLRDGGF